MLFLFIYLAIGGLFWTGFTIGSQEIVGNLAKLYKKEKYSELFSMLLGYLVALAFIIIWLPFVIVTIILRIFDK